MIHIKKWEIILLLIVLLCISACSKDTNENVNIIKYKPLDYEIYFISNHSNTEVEKVYIDALLTLQRESATNEITWDREIINNEESLENVTIKKYPSLIIYKDGKVMKQISDKTSKENIITNVKNVIYTN